MGSSSVFEFNASMKVDPHYYKLFKINRNSIKTTSPISIYASFVLIRYWDDLTASSRTALLLGLPQISIFWTAVLEFGGYLFLSGKKAALGAKAMGSGRIKEKK